jgi:multiple sugar transport system permease protein
VIRRKRRSIVLWWVATLMALVVFLVPVYWLVTTSLKGPLDVMAYPPKLLFTPTLENYEAVFSGITEIRPGEYVPANPDFPRQLMNSAIASATAALVCLALGAPAAYALSRLSFRFKRDIGFFVLGSRFVAPIIIIIPIFSLFATAGLTNSLPGLIVIYIAMNVGLVVWLLKGFFDEIPREIDEAAMVEGCDRFAAFRLVVLPLTRPGLVATGILTVLFVWNEFLFALMLTSKETTTATVGLTTFIAGRQIAWGSLCAAGTIVTLPVLILAMLTQRHLVRGFTGGAVHG